MIEVGDEIGAYRVIRRLGQGGFGAVYEVEHRQLGVHYALKTFTLAAGRHQALFRERFLAEGRILARLKHPNVARVFDLDVVPGTDVAYYVMDLVRYKDGQAHTLADVDVEGADEPHLVRWFVQLASALDYIHRMGIVHRDIKLSNILLDDRGGVVLTDFGISRFVTAEIRREVGVVTTGAACARDRVTGGLILGTEGYMAPEILQGREASAASDTYALGISFFRLLTGIWYEPGTQAFELLAPFDRAWTQLLGPMLAPDPAARPIVLKEAGERLQTATGTAVGTPSPAAPRSRSRRAFALAAVAGLALVGGAFAWRFVASSSGGSGGGAAVTAAGRTMRLDLGGGIGLELLACPAGGDVAGDYRLAKYPLTVEQWTRLVERRTVTNRQALALCHAPGFETALFATLNRAFAAEIPPGWCFRLPTEAELRRALTAGGRDVVSELARGELGPSEADKVAEHVRRTGSSAGSNAAKARTTTVGLNRANGWGFHDVVGTGMPLVTSADGRRLYALGESDLDARPEEKAWRWMGVLRVCLGPKLDR